MSASELLAAALTYRDASARTDTLPDTFEDAEAALDAWRCVLLHEAREALATPLATMPESLYLHPVDMETEEPGIVDTRTGPHVMRRAASEVPRIDYRRHAPATCPAPPPAPPPPAPPVPRAQAEREAADALCARQALAEREAKAYERRRAKAEEAKEARRQETPDARAARLEDDRRKRAERKAAKAAKASDEEAAAVPARAPEAPEADAETSEARAEAEAEAEARAEPDATVATLPRKAARTSKSAPRVHEHPLPHHRHLRALQRSAPGGRLLRAMLCGEESDDLEILQGPPGTGKTRALVQRLSSLPDGWRAFLCAPTNVGAANLYARLVSEGYEDDAALVLAPERVPAGTAVLSSDPARRFVCECRPGAVTPEAGAEAADTGGSRRRGAARGARRRRAPASGARLRVGPRAAPRALAHGAAARARLRQRVYAGGAEPHGARAPGVPERAVLRRRARVRPARACCGRGGPRPRGRRRGGGERHVVVQSRGSGGGGGDGQRVRGGRVRAPRAVRRAVPRAPLARHQVRGAHHRLLPGPRGAVRAAARFWANPPPRRGPHAFSPRRAERLAPRLGRLPDGAGRRRDRGGVSVAARFGNVDVAIPKLCIFPRGCVCVRIMRGCLPMGSRPDAARAGIGGGRRLCGRVARARRERRGAHRGAALRVRASARGERRRARAAAGGGARVPPRRRAAPRGRPLGRAREEPRRGAAARRRARAPSAPRRCARTAASSRA